MACSPPVHRSRDKKNLFCIALHLENEVGSSSSEILCLYFVRRQYLIFEKCYDRQHLKRSSFDPNHIFTLEVEGLRMYSIGMIVSNSETLLLASFDKVSI